MSQSSPRTQMYLRLPPDLLDALRVLAQLHDRSINAEITRACRRYVDAHRSPTKSPNTDKE